MPEKNQARHRSTPGRVVTAGFALLMLVLVPIGVSRLFHGSGRRVQAPTGHLGAVTTTSTGVAPSRDLLLISAGRLEVVDARTGKVARTVRIKGPTTLLGGPTIGPGDTVYANRGADICKDSAVVAISMATGRQRIVVPHAFGAVSPNRRYLAYVREIAPPKRYGEPQSCATGQTYVRDLRTGDERSWNITTHETGDEANQLIETMAWSADGRHLVLTSLGDLGFRSLTQILAVDDQQSPTNPSAVGGEIAYDSPILLPDGDLMGIVETCPDAASCPGQEPPFPPSTVNIVRPTTGAVVSSFQSNPGDEALAIDPSGQRIEVLVGHRSGLTLEHLVGHRLDPTIHATDAQGGGFTWIPASDSPESSP